MATMANTMVRPGYIGRPSGHTAASDRQKARAVETIEEPKSSVWHGIMACAATLGLALACVLAPAAGPLNAEAARIADAQYAQDLVRRWESFQIQGPTAAAPTEYAPSLIPFISAVETTGTAINPAS